MVTDRGGLRYPIEVVDQFSTNLRKFRDEVTAARRDFAQFRRSTIRTSRDAAQAETAARRQQAAAANDEARAERERIRLLKARVDQQARAEKELGRVVRQARRDADARRRAEERAEAARLKATQAAAAGAAIGARNQALLRREVEKTESAANRIAFTFRRLFGIFAAFQLVREGGRAFVGLVREGLRFNQTIESSRLGIAGIITATSKVKDEQGKVVQGAEAYNVAIGLARQQQKQLQRDALRTTATYEELLRAFQIATGPGLAQGLNLDQIREFSVLISQAATAIDLPQNQLSEEIRALLTGNIRATTTRIAQVLNLTNADIRNAQEQGNLFEFLRNRLQGFALAAEDAANTAGGLARRIAGALQVIAGEAAADSFGTLRSILRDIFETLLIVERNADGAITAITPSPQVVEVFERIFDALEAIAQKARTLAQNTGFEGLNALVATFATTLEVVGTLLVDVVAGVTRGFANLQTIFSPIVAGFQQLGTILESVFGVGAANEFLVAIVQMLTVVYGIRIAFGGVVGIVGNLIGLYPKFLNLLGSSLLRLNNIVAATRIWVAESKVGAATWNIIRSRAFLVGSAFLLVVKGVELVAESLLGIDLQLRDLPELFGTLFEQVFTKIIGFGDVVFTTMKVRAQQAFNLLVALAGQAVADLKSAFDLSLGASDELKRLKAQEKANENRIRAVKLAEQNNALELEITEAKQRQAQISKDADVTAGKRLNKLRDEANLRKDLADGINRQIAADSRAGDPAKDRPGSTGPQDEKVSDEDKQELRNLQQKIALRQIELRLRKDITRINLGTGTRAEKEVASLAVQVSALQAKLALTKAISAEEIGRFEAENQASLKGNKGEEAKTFAQEKLNALKAQQKLTEGEITDEIERQGEQLRLATLIAQGSAGQGLGEGLRQFADQFSSEFQAGLDIARSALNSFASFVSQTLVDAFDPTKDFDIQERFARFLQQIAQQVLETLTRLAIAKAILGLGLGAAEGGEVPSLGFAEGGQIPRRRARARTHARARGYAKGGDIRRGRPSNLDPRDTVPIWAQPGEWVMRLDAVRKYGADFMDALNRGILDPSELRGARRLSPKSRVRRIGFADGGEIGRAAAGAQEIADAVKGGGGGSASTTVQPVLVADNASVERMLAGGRQAFLSAIKDSAPEIEASLARYRRN